MQSGFQCHPFFSQMSDSQPKVDPALMMASLNTPRILELDINRMMIGQNTIR